jgi:Domain of unknown function (DUF4184)
MPFTLAHPAAVLPIHSRWKRWLSLAPLVVGSMVPDAGYYLPMPDGYKEHAHTWLGPLYSLPLGIAVLLIFYWVAPEIAFLLPSPHREALQSKIKTPARSVWSALLAACGIVIGAETHIAWDSFSHSDGWLVEHIRFLREPIGRIQPYFVSEVLSSLAGIWILLYVYDRWAKSQGFRVWTWQDSSWRAVLWLAVLTACVVPAVIESHTVRAILSLSFLYGRHFALVFATSFVRNFLVALCAVALYMKVFRRRTPLDVVY